MVGKLDLIEEFVKNSGHKTINVEYVVLHSTSGPVSKIINQFNDIRLQKSCHFIIDENGLIYNTLKLYDNDVIMGWHAGRSLHQNREGKIISEFNEFSIGIELINRNCNIYKYSPKLLESLVSLIEYLKSNYSSLRSPDRIIGHEHISGYRGKVDPGHMFDWGWFYKKCYNTAIIPNRLPNMSSEYRELLYQIDSTCTQEKVLQKTTNKIIRELSLHYQKIISQKSDFTKINH